MRVLMGNVAPIEVVDDAAAENPNAKTRRPIALPDGAAETVTKVGFETATLGDAFTTITAPGRGIWHAHSDQPPAWVASDRAALAELLADHYGCEVRPMPVEG